MSSRESESRNARGKVAAEVALKLEKSYLSVDLGTYVIVAKKKMLFYPIIWIDLLFYIKPCPNKPNIFCSKNANNIGYKCCTGLVTHVGRCWLMLDIVE